MGLEVLLGEHESPVSTKGQIGGHTVTVKGDKYKHLGCTMAAQGGSTQLCSDKGALMTSPSEALGTDLQPGTELQRACLCPLPASEPGSSQQRPPLGKNPSQLLRVEKHRSIPHLNPEITGKMGKQKSVLGKK